MSKQQHRLWYEMETTSNINWENMPPTFKHAVFRWMFVKAHKKSLIRDKQIVEWLVDRKMIGLNTKLNDITDERVLRIMNAKKSQTTASNSNHYLSFLKSLFNIAMDWGWRDKPCRTRKFSVDNIRTRVISDVEVQKLLSELPEHLVSIAEFSLLTGLRKSNVTNLKWEQVDFQRNIIEVKGEEFKNGRTQVFPINKRAMNILKTLVGTHDKWVFTYKGNRIMEPSNSAFKKAKDRAGIKNLRWHDFRRTFATNHLRNGTSINQLKRLGGWKSTQVIEDRYAHLNASDLEDVVNNAMY